MPQPASERKRHLPCEVAAATRWAGGMHVIPFLHHASSPTHLQRIRS